MEGSDQLLTLAEIGAAFAGYTAIVGVLSQSSGRRPGPRFNFWLMIEFSFATIFFSLFPFAISNFQVASALVWSSSSLLMSLFLFGHLLIVGRHILSAVDQDQMPKYGPYVIAPLFLGVGTIQILNAFGIIVETSYAGYFIGLLMFLLLAFANFIFLLYQISASDEQGTRTTE